MQDWLDKITNWFLNLVKTTLQALIDFVLDMVYKILDFVITPLFELIAAIPMPDFLTQYSIGGLLSGAHPMVGYIAVALNIPEAMAIISAGVLFRLTRKLLTLGQW